MILGQRHLASRQELSPGDVETKKKLPVLKVSTEVRFDKTAENANKRHGAESECGHRGAVGLRPLPPASTHLTDQTSQPTSRVPSKEV